METDKTQSPDKNYWNKWYVVVLLFLIAQIIIFYFITRYFN